MRIVVFVGLVIHGDGDMYISIGLIVSLFAVQGNTCMNEGMIGWEELQKEGVCCLSLMGL